MVNLDIALRHEYIRQLISDGISTVVYVRSSKNLADPLTKGHSRDMIKSTTSAMGLKYFRFVTNNGNLTFLIA